MIDALPTSAARSAPAAEKISLVVPVYNEHDNIGACLRGLGAALASTPHEILVCYDFDEDTTLAAIAAMPDKPPSVRLVKNTIGRGAANALRAGFTAATGDVVVTTMADLSDPPQDVLRMAALMRARHLAVVAGSRYMRGGKQIGGPWLKRTMSRMGGVSLRWIAGLGTHDATSNFRAYSKAFLDAVDIESRTGFQIALELTVKAHLRGQGVGEVPTTWTDRTAGESRFKLWKWLPSYLGWWWRAAWQPLVVGLVWLLMTMRGLLRSQQHPAAWRWMEGTSAASDGNAWAPYVEIALPSILALATLLVVRKVRGRTLLVDAFLPLLWLSAAMWPTALVGLTVSVGLPLVLAGSVVMASVAQRRRGSVVR